MTNPDLTSLALVVDRSGSMTNIAADMNGGIATLLKEQAQQPGQVLLDVFTFDDTVEHVVSNEALDASYADDDWVRPRGATALNDAVGKAIGVLGDRFAALPEEQRPGNVIVVVVTDGHENASHEWTNTAIKDLVKDQTEQWGWTFLYLAANVDAFATGRALGFGQGQTIAYASNHVGTQSVYAATSAAVTRTRRGGAPSAFTDEERESAAQE